MPTPDRPMVIGIGNRARGDDGVGPLVIDLLREPAPTTERRQVPGPAGVVDAGDLETLIVDGDLCDLALRWRIDQSVIVIDAVRSGGEPGTLFTIDGLRTPQDAGRSPLSSHGIGLVEAIELGRILGRLPRLLTVFGIEGASFDHLAPVSEPVATAAAALAQRIRSDPALTGQHGGCDLDDPVDGQQR